MSDPGRSDSGSDPILAACARQIIFYVERFHLVLERIKQLLERDIVEHPRRELAAVKGILAESQRSRKRDITHVRDLIRKQEVRAELLYSLLDAAGIGGKLRNVYCQCWETIKRRLSGVRQRLSDIEGFRTFEEEVGIVNEIETDLRNLSHYAADVMEYGAASNDVSQKFERQFSGAEPLETPEGEPEIEDHLVTLNQVAAVVHRSKRTLEKYRRHDDPEKRLPDPHIRGGGGRPHEYSWQAMKGWIQRVFGYRASDLPPRPPEE